MSLRFIPTPREPAHANSAFPFPALPACFYRSDSNIFLVPASAPESTPRIAPTPFILIEFGAECGFSVFPERLPKLIGISQICR
jgi:hypothetical protein